MPIALFADSMTRHLGQYLVAPSAFFGWFTLMGLVAVAIMMATINWLLRHYASKLAPGTSGGIHKSAIAVGGVVGIVTTLVLTSMSLALFTTVLSVRAGTVSQDRAQAAGISESQYREHQNKTAMTRHAAKSAAIAVSRNRFVKAFVAVAAILLMIGAGYAHTVIELPFWDSFITMTAGVGFPEELAKAAAGLFILYKIFDVKQLSQQDFRRAVLVSFGLAGLGFGAGEALKYFGEYAQAQLGFEAYLVRAVWCVTLHGAWALVVGNILSADWPNWGLPREWEVLFKDKANLLYMLVVACLPTAIAHGLYNTLCFRGSILAYVVGVACLLFAHRVCQDAAGAGKGDVAVAS